MTVWMAMAIFGGAVWLAFEANEHIDTEGPECDFETKEDMYDD